MTATRPGTSPLRQLFPFLPKHEDWPRFQHTLEQWPHAAFLVAPRTGAFITSNARTLALTGLSRDELAARALAEIMAAPEAREALEAFHALTPGQTRQLLAVPLRVHAGRAVLVDLRLSALIDPEQNETLVLALAWPVEERLAQEREAAQQARLVAHSDRLAALMESPTETALPEAVERVRDMFAAEAAGFFRVTLEPLGLRLEYAQGVTVNFPRALGPSEAQFFESPTRWSSGQRAESFAQQSARAAGWTHFFTHPVGEPPGVLGALFIAFRPDHPPAAPAPALLGLVARQIHLLIAQITRQAELVSAQKLATRLTHQLAALNAQIDEGLVIINALGAIDEINTPAARMLGYRAEDVIGLKFDDVLVSGGALTDTIRLTLANRGPEVVEDKLHRRNGEAFPALARLRPLPGAEGGCVLTLRDLSGQQASALQREHLDQLAYVGQATQSFAHEVRGPLNNIAMGVQFLAARLPGDDSTQQAIAKIQAECNRLSGLMRDMLAWAKPVEPRLEPANLTQLLQRLLARWNHKIEQRNVRPVFNSDDHIPPVLADTRLIEQVFGNLIDNALQVMPAGGQLTLSVRAPHRAAQGRVVEVSVADTGPGIPEETQRHIFDPYFTTKPDGTGLGLAICKRLVTVHHGAIAVGSFPGTGTAFTVTLPALETPI